MGIGAEFLRIKLFRVEFVWVEQRNACKLASRPWRNHLQLGAGIWFPQFLRLEFLWLEFLFSQFRVFQFRAAFKLEPGELERPGIRSVELERVDLGEQPVQWRWSELERSTVRRGTRVLYARECGS